MGSFEGGGDGMSATANGLAFRVVRQPRMRDSVVDQLVGAIVRGELITDAKLPTEAELIQTFGVSRTVVREALKVLEEKGLIDVQHGRGAIVLPRERWNVLDPDVLGADMEGRGAPQLLEELTRVRIALECEMAEQAAVHATPEQLTAMSQLVERTSQMLDSSDDFLVADLAFHDLIMEAAGNSVARAIMASIREPLKRSRRITNRIPGGIEHAQAFHEAILDQLRQRNPVGARDAMREHLVWHLQAWQDTAHGDQEADRPPGEWIE